MDFRDPRILHKYRSLREQRDLDRVEQILLHNEIYFATADSFNDPFEIRYITDPTVTSSELIEFVTRKLMSANLKMSGDEAARNAINMVSRQSERERVERIEQAGQSSIEKFRSSVGVLCLSEPSDEPLLWSHYADSHFGICIEFEATSTTPFFGQALEIIYSENVPIVNPFRDDDLTRLEKSLLTKAICWKYEKEFRIVDVIGGPGVREFPPETLRSVILGARIDPSVEARIREWVGKRPAPVPIRRCRLAARTYSLEIE